MYASNGTKHEGTIYLDALIYDPIWQGSRKDANGTSRKVTGTFTVKAGMAQMLKVGLFILDVRVVAERIVEIQNIS